MIAQDFARRRVLGSGSIATAYGVATTCAHAGKRPARARPAQFVSGRSSENANNLLKPTNIQLINKRLGEICGLGVAMRDAPSARHRCPVPAKLQVPFRFLMCTDLIARSHSRSARMRGPLLSAWCWLNGYWCSRDSKAGGNIKSGGLSTNGPRTSPSRGKRSSGRTVWTSRPGSSRIAEISSLLPATRVASAWISAARHQLRSSGHTRLAVLNSRRESIESVSCSTAPRYRSQRRCGVAIEAPRDSSSEKNPSQIPNQQESGVEVTAPSSLAKDRADSGCNDRCGALIQTSPGRISGVRPSSPLTGSTIQPSSPSRRYWVGRDMEMPRTRCEALP